MLKTIRSDYKRFNDIADVILNRTVLCSNTKRYRICEIEFYYHGDNHEDQYTHQSDEQKMRCKFYFHKYHNGTYKSGTYKGLDITLSPNDQTYFGILIRSIYDLDGKKFIEGPCKSVDELLSQFNFQTVNQFVEDKDLPLDIYEEENGIYLRDAEDDELREKTIYKGPRIGLSDKYLNFKAKKYRYAIMTKQLKKGKNTFITV